MSRYHRISEPLKLALSLLTRLPVRVATPVRDDDQGNAVALYPVVGLLIGGILAASVYALSSSNPLVAAVLVVALWCAITGALHLDGLADSADAWLGGFGDRTRTLAIMKDPTSGPAGVVSLVLILLGKTAALSALLNEQSLDTLLVTVIFATVLARAACSALFLFLPYVRDNGLGSAAAQRTNKPLTQLSLIGCIIAALWCGQFIMLATAIAFFLAGIYIMRQRLGGFTGDTAGALVEVVECMTLLSVAIFL